MKIIKTLKYKLIAVAHINTQEEIRSKFSKKLESLSNIDSWQDVFDIGTTDMPDYDEILNSVKDGELSSDKAELKMMNPMEYKNLVGRGFWTHESNKQKYKTFENFSEFVDKRDPWKIERVLDSLIGGSKFPIPVIHYKDGGKSFYQEGNHRSEVAELLGVQEIPVLIVNPYAVEDLDTSGYEGIDEIKAEVFKELSNGDPFNPGEHVYTGMVRDNLSSHFYVTTEDIFAHFNADNVNFSLAKTDEEYFEYLNNPERYFLGWINGDETDSPTYRREFYQGFDSESFYKNLVNGLSREELMIVHDKIESYQKKFMDDVRGYLGL